MAGGSNASGAADELDWKFVQSFGDDNSSDGQRDTARETSGGRKRRCPQPTAQQTARGEARRGQRIQHSTWQADEAHTFSLFVAGGCHRAFRLSPLLRLPFRLLAALLLPLFALCADDLVTAVEFDETGQYLAVGDKAGRICIFEGHAVTASPNSNKKPIIPLEYKFYTEFQSHEPEFDCLKSLEIEEKINMIKWGKKINNGLFLLACNGQETRTAVVT